MISLQMSNELLCGDDTNNEYLTRANEHIYLEVSLSRISARYPNVCHCRTPISCALYDIYLLLATLIFSGGGLSTKGRDGTKIMDSMLDA
jgi:hypothetical protein